MTDEKRRDDLDRDVLVQWVREMQEKQREEVKDLEREMARFMHQQDQRVKWREGLAEAIEEQIILLKDIRTAVENIAFHLTVSESKKNEGKNG
jgi:hypothetical protein